MLGNNIKIYREKVGISQRELARRINKTGQFISLVEQGKSKPSIDVLEKIAHTLKIGTSKLLDNENLYPEELVKASGDYFLEQYLYTLGYKIICEMENGYMILELKDGSEFEINESDIVDLKNSTKSFIQFKIHEIIKRSRKIGK